LDGIESSHVPGASGGEEMPAKEVHGMYFVLDFIELKPFEKAWKNLRLADDDLFALQQQIM
jgi:hypothetical protein